uniref:1-phosphatidylinositol-3-phosphate 5-kinase n=1 Tax=Albugo laibachii Nc14 TaxID=890382 RepID=F0WKE4_9STRA|nr:Phosphatidylinositol3phosphate5 kinase (Fablike PIPKA1) putative [Albugo laibachii Nc14]|eukprot:CCA21748.1 Phosphatidylinositol3phosphate5 kinase (Fablike PIPKA1) putative [Albugo laibachii Nc14]
MITLCDVLNYLLTACTSGCFHNHSVPSGNSNYQTLHLLPAFEATKKRRFSTNYAVECTIELEIPSYFLEKEVQFYSTNDLFRVLGVELTQTTKKNAEYHITVKSIASNSKAETVGVQRGAVISRIQEEKLCHLSYQDALDRIHDKLREFFESKTGHFHVEFLQCSQDSLYSNSDMYAITRFPSPQGRRLPRVHQFALSQSDTVNSMENTTPSEDPGRSQAFVYGVPNPTLGRHHVNSSRPRTQSTRHFWMSDRSAKACYECDKLFTFFRRRHHCRSCGQIFCSDCCTKLQNAGTSAIMNDSMKKLRKQLVCHTCHRQLREGLQLDVSGGVDSTMSNAVVLNSKASKMTRSTSGNGSFLFGDQSIGSVGSAVKHTWKHSKFDTFYQDPSPSSQTLMLIPPNIAAALQKSTLTNRDSTRICQLETGEVCEKDETNEDIRQLPPDQSHEKMRPSALFSIFPRVQIVASVQQLTHQPRFCVVGAPRYSDFVKRRNRVKSLPLRLLNVTREALAGIVPKEMESVVATKLKRSNSDGTCHNPSHRRWNEKEFKQLIEESNMEALIASTLPPSQALQPRQRAVSVTVGDIHFGHLTRQDPWEICARTDERYNDQESTFRSSGTLPSASLVPTKAFSKELALLHCIGLSKDAIASFEDMEAIRREKLVAESMTHHAKKRTQEKISRLFQTLSSVSRLSHDEQEEWMQIIQEFSHRAATSILCEPDAGDRLDVMEYVQIKSISSGNAVDSFFIDGVLVHRSLARKGMRTDIEYPRILLIASSLEYQRKRDALSSLECVANQEIEYMHLITEKLMIFGPDIVLFGGHVHRVAEELLFKENVVVVKNVRLVDLQRVARNSGASLLASCDHVDKISEKNVLGTCRRFYVLITEQEPKSERSMRFAPFSNSVVQDRQKRPQRQNIVFDCGPCTRGCTVCLRGASEEVLEEISSVLCEIIRSAYNMRLQRAALVSSGFLPTVPDATTRSFAEEWFVQHSSSLYLSLKSNSLSMRAALKESRAMCKPCLTQSSSVYEHGKGPGLLDSERNCACNLRATEDLCNRILFSTCWSSLDGKTASSAEMMCIDFYSSNDCSLGQFLMKYCFDRCNRDFRRAFRGSKLSFSHDTTRITLSVKDLFDAKEMNEKQTHSNDIKPGDSPRVLLRVIKSDQALMWSRRVDESANGSNSLATRYAHVHRDVWNYSFGKFLEDLFYGKTMEIDTFRLPHLQVRNSRDPCLIRYFSKHGRIVSLQYEPLKPVLHVALQPMLWQDHIDQKEQIEAVQELCALASQVYAVTTEKVEESLADFVPPPHAKYNLKILQNEVRQWYSCYALKIEADPPLDIFAKNRHIKEIHQHAADWSLRIRQATHATVKLSLKHPENSPKSMLPRAWFSELATEMDKQGSQTAAVANSTSESSTFFEHATPTHHLDLMTPIMENAGDLSNLATVARNLATRKQATMTPLNSFGIVSNEVTNTLNTHWRNGIYRNVTFEDGSGDYGTQDDDHASHTFPAHDFSWESTAHTPNPSVAAQSSYSTQMALEAFQKSRQRCGAYGLGYFTIPKSILQNHPSLPVGVKDTVILVNPSQPTSVVAYSLCSKFYTRQLNQFLAKESSHSNPRTQTSIQMETNGLSVEEEIERLVNLRSCRRTNVDHVFVDENEFQPATRFSCKSYYAMQFHALRRLYYGGDRNYIESLCHCEQWNAAGGKSGAEFLKTTDQRFIAKAIPQIEVQMFLSMANDYFAYMAKTFQDNLSSMLSKVLGIYKVSISNDVEQTMCILVMENLIYGREVNFSFDLKGKLEGRFRTSSAVAANSVLWDRNFVEMASGIPLPLQESAMSLLLSAVMSDTAFLASVQATDYSMLVGYDLGKQEIVACIIDYIHKYDFLKMVEHAGKRLIQEEDEITVLNPKHYRKRFCHAMTKYFTTIPSRFTRVTTVVRPSMNSTSLSGTLYDDSTTEGLV